MKNIAGVLMTTREWAIRVKPDGKEQQTRSHIKSVATWYQKQSTTVQNEFDKLAKRSFKCEFCPTKLTACSIKSNNKKAAYFGLSNKGDNSTSSCNGNCEIYYDDIGDDTPVSISGITTASDPSLFNEISDVDELKFLELKENNSTKTNKKNTSKNTSRKGSSIAHTIGSVVKYYIQKKDGYKSLTVPNVTKPTDSYGKVFQKLKVENNHVFFGWHIYFGELSNSVPMVEDENYIIFNLENNHLAQPIRIAINKHSSKWSKEKLNLVKRAFNDSLEHHNPIHIFVLSNPDINDNGLFWVDDYPYLYLVSSNSFNIPYANWGVKEIKKQVEVEFEVENNVIPVAVAPPLEVIEDKENIPETDQNKNDTSPTESIQKPMEQKSNTSSDNIKREKVAKKDKGLVKKIADYMFNIFR